MTELQLAQPPNVSIDDSWVDYLIVAIYVAVTLGIGIALRKRMRSSEDFFLAGRSLPSLVSCICCSAGR